MYRSMYPLLFLSLPNTYKVIKFSPTCRYTKCTKKNCKTSLKKLAKKVKIVPKKSVIVCMFEECPINIC